MEQTGEQALPACPSREERKAKAQGLTVAAADLCSFVSGAAEGEGGKDRVVLPVSWDPHSAAGQLAQPWTNSPATQEDGESVRSG